MAATRFDSVSKLFANLRLSRRQAISQGGAGLAAGALAAVALAPVTSAQEATPDAVTEDTPAPAMLFVQTYQAGSIAPTEGVEGRYTLTLEQGHGQTVYFSDRPDRIVGADPTPQFLEGMPFLDDNPPNAALIIETAPGETDVAVVELFSPLYDPITQGVTYEVEVLANWQAELGMALHEAPTDLAALAPAFGSAQLFIDDCPDSVIECLVQLDDLVGQFNSMGMCWNYSACIPCQPYGHVQPSLCATAKYWTNKCEERFADDCKRYGGCHAQWDWPGFPYWVCEATGET